MILKSFLKQPFYGHFTISFCFGFLASFLLIESLSSSIPAPVATSYLLAAKRPGTAGGNIHPGWGHHQITTWQLGSYQLFLK